MGIGRIARIGRAEETGFLRGLIITQWVVGGVTLRVVVDQSVTGTDPLAGSFPWVFLDDADVAPVLSGFNITLGARLNWTLGSTPTGSIRLIVPTGANTIVSGQGAILSPGNYRQF